MFKQALYSATLMFAFALPSYADLVDNGDGTITDTDTGLMWLQNAHQMPGSNWAQSQLNADNLSYAGHDDWRQPELSELETLYTTLSASGSFSPAPFTNLEIDGSTDWYWSNNRDNPGCTGWACFDTWYFDFETGTANQAGATYFLYSLPVRTISPSSCNLVDNGDGTVTDPNSALMWLQDGDAVGATPWSNADAIITTANYAGHNDWRLPEIAELQGLYNKLTESGAYNPAPFVNLDINGVSDWHWSNTTAGQVCWWTFCQPTKFYVDFSSGSSGAVASSYSLSSLAVRNSSASCP